TDNNYVDHTSSSFSNTMPSEPPRTVPRTIAHPSLTNRLNKLLRSMAQTAIKLTFSSFLTDGTSNPINMAYKAIPMLWLSFSGMTSPSTPPKSDPKIQASQAVINSAV